MEPERQPVVRSAQDANATRDRIEDVILEEMAAALGIDPNDDDDSDTTLSNSLTAALLPKWSMALARLRRALPRVPAHVFSGFNTSESFATDQGPPAYVLRSIARTAATATFNVDQLHAFVFEGIRTKRWVTRHDDDVRPTHKAEDGVTLPLGTPFIVGPTHSPMQYPGDQRTATIGLWVQCRCVLLPGE
jgi:hypothetical protein